MKKLIFILCIVCFAVSSYAIDYSSFTKDELKEIRTEWQNKKQDLEEKKNAEEVKYQNAITSITQKISDISDAIDAMP